MPAHAPYLCERCHDAGKMPEPVDLPVGAKKCPFCGKAKWLARIWGGYTPLVSSERGRSFIAASEKLGEAGYDDQKARRAALQRRSNNPNAPRIVAPHQLGQALAAATGGGFSGGLPGVQPGTTTVESIRPIRTEGGLTRHLAPPRPGPGSLVAPDKMPGQS